MLIVEASEIICERVISLFDCFCLASAKANFCVAVFAKRENMLVAKMQKGPLGSFSSTISASLCKPIILSSLLTDLRA